MIVALQICITQLSSLSLSSLASTSIFGQRYSVLLQEQESMHGSPLLRHWHFPGCEQSLSVQYIWVTSQTSIGAGSFKNIFASS